MIRSRAASGSTRCRGGRPGVCRPERLAATDLVDDINQVGIRYFPFRVRLGHGEAVAFGEFPVGCLISQFLEAGAKGIASGVLSEHQPSGRDTDRLGSE